MPDFTPEAQATVDVLTNAVIVARAHTVSRRFVIRGPRDVEDMMLIQQALDDALDELVEAVDRADEIRKAVQN